MGTSPQDNRHMAKIEDNLFFTMLKTWDRNRNAEDEMNLVSATSYN
jgi:hypothetical protein